MTNSEANSTNILRGYLEARLSVDTWVHEYASTIVASMPNARLCHRGYGFF